MLTRLAITTLLSLSIPPLALGQSVKDLVVEQATINLPDQTIVVEFKSVKSKVLPDSEKWYFWYAANQIHATQGGFSGKLLNGTCSSFHLNKNLKEAGKFKKGLKIGFWNAWSENGNLKEKTSWKSGVKNGAYYKYNDQGILKESGRYKNGVLKNAKKAKWKRFLNKMLTKKTKPKKDS